MRAFTRWSDSQLKRHMKRLEDLEYLIVHRGGRGQSFVYELFFEAAADAARSTLPGLEHEYDGEKSGLEAQKSGGGLGQVRGMSGGGAVDKSPVSMRLPASLLTNPLEITSTEAAEQNRIVGLPPRSMNGRVLYDLLVPLRIAQGSGEHYSESLVTGDGDAQETVSCQPGDRRFDREDFPENVRRVYDGVRKTIERFKPYWESPVSGRKLATTPKQAI